MTDTQWALLEWFSGGDTGLSSEALANEFAGLPHDKDFGINYPRDGSDLGRCVRLIDRIPPVRDAVEKLAARNKYWAALAPEWDRLVTLYRAEIAENPRSAPKTYAAMRAVLDPVQAADPSVVVIGPGITMGRGR